MTDFASLVFLSYNRPAFIFDAIGTARENAGYPCEIIVVDDGSTDDEMRRTLVAHLQSGLISQLVLAPRGHNEGVGRSIRKGFSLASGDPIIKLDQDLLFREDWLARAVGILRQDEAVGMLGFFKYHHEPVEWQDKRIDIPTKGGYHYTRQFCGSGFAIPRKVYEELGPLDQHLDAFNEDSNYMTRVRNGGYELALPDVDLCDNRGFGYGPSTVCIAPDKVQGIHHRPHVIDPNEKTPRPQNARDITPVPVTAESPPAPENTAFPHEFRAGVVITTCAGREENLRRTVGNLMELDTWPQAIVVVYDGCPAQGFDTPIQIHGVEIPKHAPGQEQPRNVGFQRLRELAPRCNYVWFLDSDLIFEPSILTEFYRGLSLAEEERILIGPYDWLAPGVTAPVYERGGAGVLQPDYRWCSFDEHGPDHVLRHDLGAGLANFSGNLVYPVKLFERVGGFHRELHHGRCEDGELGLRACEMGLPMSFVRTARAWHVFHPVDSQAVMTKNARDVVLLNQMHPWVENEGLKVVDVDGKRFDWVCPGCRGQFNTLSYWEHARGCHGAGSTSSAA